VLIVVAAALTVAAIIGSLLLVRGAWRAWLLFGVYLGISVTLVARARLGFIGPFIGRDHRYLTDLAVIAPLCLALAWLPLQGKLDAQSPPRTSPRALRRRARIERIQARLTRRRAAITTTAAVAVLAMGVGGVISGETFMSTWSKNPSQDYFENLEADLKAHKGPVYLFGDEVVPNLIMTPTFLEDRQIGAVTKPLAVRPVVSPAVPYFSIVDPSGHLHDGVVRGVDIALPAPDCGTSTDPAIVQLPSAPGAGRWKVRLGFYTNRQTTARVAIGSNPPVETRLGRGLHEIYVSLLAGGSNQLRMDGIDAGASVCIGSLTIGFPAAKP
jgi:hypothetical protein